MTSPKPDAAIAPCDVSVVIATHRRERQLVEAIESALGQEGVSVEVIVVDDAPEGTAREAVLGVGDARVRYLVRAETSGGRPSVVRNQGAALARGPLLHFLDDDDRLLPGALQAQAAALAAASGAAVALGRVVPFGEDPSVLAVETAFFERAARRAASLGGSARGFAREMLFGPTLLVNSACMVRRALFERLGGYDSTLSLYEDIEFFARAGRAGGVAFVDRPVLGYRVGAPSLTHALKAAGGQDDRVRLAYRTMYAKYRAGRPLEFLALRAQSKALHLLRRGG